MSNKETLFCTIGEHNWKRDTVRGVKPKVCPRHKANPTSTARTVAERTAQTLAGKLPTPAEEFPADEYPILVTVEPSSGKAPAPRRVPVGKVTSIDGDASHPKSRR